MKKDDPDSAEAQVPDGTLRRGRKITLNLQALSLGLPEDEPAGGDEETERASSIPPEERAHLDGWNADRVERASLPPASTQGISVHPPKPEPQLASTFDEPGDDGGNALDLAGRSSQRTPVLDLVSEMAERFALGDFSGCLRAAELFLGQDEAHSLANHYARESRQKLEGLYISRITALGRIPQLAVQDSEVRWLGLDSRMGFLLSRIDGESDYETLLELSGMPRLEALRCLMELVESKVVRIV